jgi:hypothetical protein
MFIELRKKSKLINRTNKLSHVPPNTLDWLCGVVCVSHGKLRRVKRLVKSFVRHAIVMAKCCTLARLQLEKW